MIKILEILLKVIAFIFLLIPVYILLCITAILLNERRYSQKIANINEILFSKRKLPY